MAKPLIHDDFLLSTTKQARELYHTLREGRSRFTTITATCRRSRSRTNHQFADLAELWLGGDHYKWRALRTNGVNERFITGDATPRDKFQAWAETMPHTLRNPLLPLVAPRAEALFRRRRIILDGKSAEKDLEIAPTRKLGQAPRARFCSRNSKVAVVCTTDDPADSLELHQQIRARAS